MTDAEWKQLEQELARKSPTELAKLVIEHRRALYELVFCFDVERREHVGERPRLWLRWRTLLEDRVYPTAKALLDRKLGDR